MSAAPLPLLRYENPPLHSECKLWASDNFHLGPEGHCSCGPMHSAVARYRRGERTANDQPSASLGDDDPFFLARKCAS